MQQLKELPKAQKLFKEYVNNQVQQLISHSQNLAKKYLSEREELKTKQQTKANSRKKIERMVRLLASMLKIPMNLRQDILQMQGLSDQELQQMKEKYQQLLNSYPQDELQESQQDKQNQPNNLQTLDLSQYSSGPLQPQINSSITIPTSRHKIICNILQFLQGITYLFSLMIIVYRIVL